MSDTEQRLLDLEIKLMELENTMAELNTVVIRQADHIDGLQRAQQGLLDRIDSVQQSPPGSDSERPPHY